MPSTINGIGTAYVGKKNVESHQDVCESCQNVVMLENYETGLWFTFLFIPVIPLGRKQVLDYCPVCTRHRVMDVGEWERLKNEVIEQSTAELTEKQDDPEAAVKLHATFVAFKQHDEASDLAQAMATSFADNVDVQLYLGAWYEQIGRDQEADACFERALAIDPQHPGAIRAAGIGLLQEGKLEEGAQLLSALQPPSEHYDPVVFFVLGKAFQDQGQHAQALENFKLILSHSPAWGRDKTFRKTVRESEKALGGAQSLVRSDPFYKQKVFLWATAAALVVVALIGWNVYIANNRQVHVVNGLPISITVELNGGKTVNVGPGGRTPVRLGEGTHRAVVKTPAAFAEPVEFQVRSGWFGRYFRSPAFVLDPTRGSVVMWERVTYSESPLAGNEPEIKLHVGEAYVQYDDLDYIFQEFPHQLRTESSKPLKKTGIKLLELEPLAVLANDPELFKRDQGLTFLEQRVKAEPTNYSVLDLYLNIGYNQDPSRCLKLLESRLGERPIDVEWHRRYQQFALLAGNVAELVQRYEQLLAEAPNDSYLLYLRGRIEGRSDAALRYAELALQADDQNGFAWSSKAYHLQGRGQFEEALVASDRAIQLQPERGELGVMRQQLLMGLGNFDVLEREIREEAADEGDIRAFHARLWKVYAARGDMAAAKQSQQQWLEHLQEEWPQDPFQLLPQSEMEMLYSEGNLQALLERAQQPDMAETAATFLFAAQLELGQTADAAEQLAQVESQLQSYYGVALSVAWRAQGDPQQAAQQLAEAVEKLAQGDAGDRYAATLLQSGPDSVAFEDARQIAIDSQHKKLILLALAETNPDSRPALLDLAEKLNFGTAFPHRFVQQQIARLRGDPQP